MEDAEPLILFLAALFCVVGVIFVGAGFGLRRRDRAFRAVALRVPGIVTDLRYRRWGPAGDGPDGVWFPVLRFTTFDGRHVDAEAMYSRSPPPARRGDQVMVVYDPADPADPTRATIDQRGVGVLGLVFVILGVLLVVIGLVIGGVLVLLRSRL